MRKKDKEFQLLVEGKNDLHVIWNLAERLNLNETFDVCLLYTSDAADEL